MTTTTETVTSFQKAILAVLSTDNSTWPQPVIYAEEINGEMNFGACNAPAMPDDAIAWVYVQSDTFGELTGNHEYDAGGIAANMYEQAVSDILDETERANQENHAD